MIFRRKSANIFWRMRFHEVSHEIIEIENRSVTINIITTLTSPRSKDIYFYQFNNRIFLRSRSYRVKNFILWHISKSKQRIRTCVRKIIQLNFYQFLILLFDVNEIVMVKKDYLIERLRIFWKETLSVYLWKQ